MENNNIESRNSDKERSTPFLEVKGIIHDYGHIRALDDVNFCIYPKEIIGLVGDNGAGKSTLIKIISGVLQQTRGKIFVDGQERKLESSRTAIDFGIETIYQDMNLINVMNIMRNIFCGREETDSFGLLKVKEMKQMTMDVLKKEITIEGIYSPYQIVKNLSGGQKQAVAIARAMFFKKKVLLLDEPTSALSVRETRAFLDHIVHLRDEGMSVVLVTHNIYHAFQVADRFVVLSHGKKILDLQKGDISIEELTNVIVAH